VEAGQRLAGLYEKRMLERIAAINAAVEAMRVAASKL
jgi:hypothetical protein